MTRRSGIGLWLVLCCLPVAHAAAPLEFDLRELEVGDQPPPVAQFAQDYVAADLNKPPALAGAPKASGQAMYGVLRLGTTERVIMLDLAAMPQLYVDSDGDGDLSDETAIEAAASAPATGGIFGALMGQPRQPQEARFQTAALKVADGAIVKFNARIYHQDSQRAYLRVSPAVYRSGEIALGDEVYRVQFVDASFDGRYDTTFSLQTGSDSDWMAVDLNRDGTFDPMVPRSQEVVPLPRLLRLGEAYYSIDVSPDGSLLRLEPVQPETGTLDADLAGGRITLWSDSGGHVLNGADRPWTLPVGQYRAMEILLEQRDDAGVRWSLQSMGNTGRLGAFTLESGEVLTTSVGEPLLGTVSVSSGTRQASLGFSLRGQAGEEYAAGAERNGRRMPAPNFRIVDESDTTITSGKFEYG